MSSLAASSLLLFALMTLITEEANCAFVLVVGSDDTTETSSGSFLVLSRTRRVQTQ